MLREAESTLLSAIRRQTWTSHNIRLTETESTLGPDRPLIGDDARTVTIKRLIRRLLGERRTLRILDLGALEGGLSLEMAREGWDALGIEGRDTNFRKADLIRQYFALPNLHFELRDVKTLAPERDGRFDVVLCCGLLYHLDEPFGFLRTLRAITNDEGLLFVDTHVAPEDMRSLDPAYKLSELETVAGYEGRWFEEPSRGSVLDQQWSAVSNTRSFWPTRRSLIRAELRARDTRP